MQNESTDKENAPNDKIGQTKVRWFSKTNKQWKSNKWSKNDVENTANKSILQRNNMPLGNLPDLSTLKFVK